MSDLALIIVDMIRDYLEPGRKLYCKAARKIIKPINHLSLAVRQAGGLVVFADTTLTSPNDPIARKWGMHAERGTDGPEIWPKVAHDPKDIVVGKTSYNSFFRTDLDKILREHDINRVAIAGIHTHVCVLLTASAASDLGYEVILFEDAMTTNLR